MDDVKAPERIWATGGARNGSWTDTAPARDWDAHAVEYVCADAMNALTKERDEAEAELLHYRTKWLAQLKRANQAEAEIARLTAERDILKNWQDHNANEVPRLKMQIEAMQKGRDQALACAAAAAMEMREAAAGVTMLVGDHQRIRALPIDPDAQKALDRLLAKAREDALREALETFRAQIESMRQNVGDWSISEVPEAVNDTLDDILALLNEGEDDGKAT